MMDRMAETRNMTWRNCRLLFEEVKHIFLFSAQFKKKTFGIVVIFMIDWRISKCQATNSLVMWRAVNRT